MSEDNTCLSWRNNDCSPASGWKAAETSCSWWVDQTASDPSPSAPVGSGGLIRTSYHESWKEETDRWDGSYYNGTINQAKSNRLQLRRKRTHQVRTVHLQHGGLLQVREQDLHGICTVLHEGNPTTNQVTCKVCHLRLQLCEGWWAERERES